MAVGRLRHEGRARRASEVRRPHGLLVRLRLFPRRTLLGRRGLPGGTVTAWMADPLRDDGVVRRHGAVLCGGVRACHGAVAAATGARLRAGARLRPRGVCARPCLHRASLEPDRLRAPAGGRHDADGRVAGRLHAQPPRRVAVCRTGSDLERQRRAKQRDGGARRDHAGAARSWYRLGEPAPCRAFLRRHRCARAHRSGEYRPSP